MRGNDRTNARAQSAEVRAPNDVRLRRRLSAAVSAVAIVLSCLVLAPETAGAAATQPDLKLPFRCGTKWQASTYDWYGGHSHGNAVDFNMIGAEDRGQPVASAAAGRVVKASGTNNDVYIDHGGGWQTRYLHMSSLQVVVGQYVSEGEWIGSVDSVGRSTGPHLHFEARRDGVKVKPTFDGVQVTVTSTTTQNFTSTNCLPGSHGLWFANEMIRRASGTVDFVTASGERYHVPSSTVATCLKNAGVRLRHVSDGAFTANRRNEYGDPAGRSADCTTWTIGWMIQGSGGAVWYVAPNGMKYHVPNEGTVMCLGGWASIRKASDSTVAAVPSNPWAMKANCQTPLYGEIIRSTSGSAVYYVSPRGHRYHVPNSSVVDCVAGWPNLVPVRSARVTALSANPYGHKANCDAALLSRVIRKSSGRHDFVDGNYRRHWIPDHGITACLGGQRSSIYLSASRFDAIPRNSTNTWASCTTKNV